VICRRSTRSTCQTARDANWRISFAIRTLGRLGALLAAVALAVCQPSITRAQDTSAPAARASGLEPTGPELELQPALAEADPDEPPIFNSGLEEIPAPIPAREPEIDLRYTPICKLGVSIAVPLPDEQEQDDQIDVPHDESKGYFPEHDIYDDTWVDDAGGFPSLSSWQGFAFCYQPLYFEEVNVERYGYKVPYVQPALSAADFYLSIVKLPYKMALEPPWSCVSTQRYERPGNHPPPYPWLEPFRLGPALVEGGVVMGLIFLIP